jgi:hypothetical protein
VKFDDHYANTTSTVRINVNGNPFRFFTFSTNKKFTAMIKIKNSTR